ncbi:hypothetical protein BDM02DRAFT_3110410 [Thelephora ganbajun]|uniref:Uncharacterized protein n=1 Tax=Thelephora ganbajun TaxID=370292 RepID=A0ACB6ZQF8_THEGA|nr:hypothetical protein BDM02DRAFT_3110410 [Thelephora ganbajun]
MSLHVPANPVHTPELAGLDRTIGILFSGYTCSMVLYGFVFFQTYTYFNDYPNDPYPLRILVGLVATLDTASVGVLTDALHTYMIVQFPVFAQAVEVATLTFTADNGLAVSIIFLVQMFYAHRLVSLSGGYIVPAIVGILSMASFALGIVMTARMHTNPAFDAFAYSPMKAIIGTCQGLTALTSILIFISMAYFTARNPSVTAKVKPLFDRILTWLLVYGGAAAVVQLLYFAVFISLPARRDWMFFQTLARRLFAINLLTTLSYREAHRGKGAFDEQTIQRSIGSTNRATPTLGSLSFNKSHAVTSRGVVVDRTIDVDTSVDLTSKMAYRVDEDTSVSDKHGPDYMFTTSHN